jgi:hypothetical protein
VLLVLYGAKKNVGDYLIRERGLSLIRHLRPHQEIVLHYREQPIDPELLARADAAVICGGPGLATNFYPGAYPLIRDLRAVDTPILPLAVGWSGRPVDHPERFAFDESSLRALATIHERIGWSSVRDDVSLRILRSAGFSDVRRSGCVAWYHLPHLGRPPTMPDRVERLVVTPPARVKLWPEVVDVLRRLRRRYPHAERWCVFHRGLKPGVEPNRRHALSRYAARSQTIAAAARALGYRVLDAAFDLASVDFYGDCDLHVGYRVHAHLSLVSQHRPSLLISEDGRGLGQSLTLGDPYSLRAGRPGMTAALEAALDAEERSGYAATLRAIEEIEATSPVMRETIEQLPAGSASPASHVDAMAG